MAYISPLGKPEAPIWCILETPFPSDESKGTLLSGGLGYAYLKMFEEAGLRKDEVYFCCRRPDTNNPHAVSSVENLALAHKPPLLLLVGEAASFWLSDLKKREGQETFKTQLNKYVGSLLTSPAFPWANYCVPLISPDDLMRDWRERNVTTYVDLGKVKDELDYFKKNKTLQPLPERELLFGEMEDGEVLQELDRLGKEPVLSVDLETVYTRANSEYVNEYPGSMLVIGIASSAKRAISFSPFRATPRGTIEVWRAVEKLFSNGALIVGQNFVNFDSFYFNMYGFSLDKSKFSDTLIRHHILWPELPHKLQFLTRQYTRQPYYKDEGKTWSLKKLNDLRHYNCLDCSVTFEVWEAQEEEFKQRPHLR